MNVNKRRGCCAFCHNKEEVDYKIFYSYVNNTNKTQMSSTGHTSLKTALETMYSVVEVFFDLI